MCSKKNIVEKNCIEYLNEVGLYQLIFRLPGVRTVGRFQDWMITEVIPPLRQGKKCYKDEKKIGYKKNLKEKKYHCDVSNVSFKSNYDLNRHFDCQKHKKNIG